MKKILLLILFIVLLTGCSEEKVVEEIDYTALIDTLYGDFESNYTECDENGVFGTTSHLEVDYIYKYSNFEEMMDDEYSGFVYGKVVEERETNCFTEAMYLEIYEVGFEEVRAIIRISVMKDDKLISVGGVYVLNLVYDEENDNYFLSQQSDSVFRVISGKIGIPNLFYEELKDKKEIDVFLDYVIR